LDPEVILLIKKNLCNIYSTNKKSVLKKNILRLIKSQSGNCDPLQPLALALLESISLFKILGDQLKPKDLKVIFDSTESRGPNLYTKLRYIRDLCSAADYGLDKLSGDYHEIDFDIVDKEVKTHGEQKWKAIIFKYVMDKTNNILEVARLLDDIYGSVQNICGCLDKINGNKTKSYWNEIHREVCHIKDHFDYAEDALLNIMQGTKGSKK